MLHPAHDTRLEVGGDLYFVRREFDLVRRIEQAFGPLAELNEKLRRFALTADELVKLYRAALLAQASRPPDELIAEHILEVGIPEASDQVAMLILHLFSGHKRAVAWLEAEAKKAAGEEEPSTEDPTPAASSPGIATSRRRRTSAGRPKSSGGPPSTT